MYIVDLVIIQTGFIVLVYRRVTGLEKFEIYSKSHTVNLHVQTTYLLTVVGHNGRYSLEISQLISSYKKMINNFIKFKPLRLTYSYPLILLITKKIKVVLIS